MENKELTPEQFWYQQPPMKNIPDAIREYHELKSEETKKVLLGAKDLLDKVYAFINEKTNQI